MRKILFIFELKKCKCASLEVHYKPITGTLNCNRHSNVIFEAQVKYV